MLFRSGFDGVETLKRIRDLGEGMYRDLPIIALTANLVIQISGEPSSFLHHHIWELNEVRNCLRVSIAVLYLSVSREMSKR